MIKPIIKDRKQLSQPCRAVTKGEDISQLVSDLKDTLQERVFLKSWVTSLRYFNT